MAKATREAGEAISLFPFLSILTCVIGTLMLLITAVAMARMVGSQTPSQEADDPAVARAKKINQLTRRLPLERDHAGRLQQEIAQREAEAAKLAAELEKAKAAHAPRELTPEEQKIRDQYAAIGKLAAAGEQALEQNKQIEAEIERTVKAVTELHEQLKAEGKLPEEREIKIVPSGSGTELTPSFVECTARGIVIHGDKGSVRIRRADLRSRPEFARLLEQVHDQADGIVIFLVRSDGVESYQEAQAIAQASYVRNGKLPVAGQGRIDLSLMRPAAPEASQP